MSEEVKNYENAPQGGGQQIIINQAAPKKSNGIGIAGFVLALIALFLGWVPVLGWILGILGFVFSFIGVFKKPKGLAIAGLIIATIGFGFWLLFGIALFAGVSGL